MQEPFLYSKTVEENIRLGSAGAREEEIISAATAARVHDSILGFESGYRTLVGERGVTLSGGQRQRVALARALLRSTPILVLDDALSAVDTDTETEILDALRRLKGSRTTIVIAHRLTTLMHADRIVVFERGRIAQIGSHAELLRQEGLYRRLWQHQSALESDFDEERRRFDTAEETRTSRGAEEMMEARERHGVKAPGEQSIRQGAEVAEES
jgi:ATP-binding cassette subfamily B protein